jgi:1-deoxy-D-xylulose-5-phosphate reductoisomerase
MLTTSFREAGISSARGEAEPPLLRKVALFGSTGSIGTQSLEIIKRNPDKFQAAILTCHKNAEILKEQIEEFAPQAVCITDEEAAGKIKKQFPNLKVRTGEDAATEAASVKAADYDIMLNALVGIAGLAPTLAAIGYGKEIPGFEIALANKETLVTGGRAVMKAASEAGIPIKPIDSEHSAVAQCIAAGRPEDIKRVIITGSGGPFRTYTKVQLKTVTLEETLSHPTWNMGGKITVDSATMMNKAFELLEAKWLFGLPESKIEAVIHPQSIIHSFVEFKDGAMLAQLGVPSMLVPISYALSMPARLESGADFLDLIKTKELTFEAPTEEAERALNLARRAMQMSEQEGSEALAIAMNAADETLTKKFLSKEIKFTEIIEGIEKICKQVKPEETDTFEKIMSIDKKYRCL